MQIGGGCTGPSTQGGFWCKTSDPRVATGEQQISKTLRRSSPPWTYLFVALRSPL